MFRHVFYTFANSCNIYNNLRTNEIGVVVLSSQKWRLHGPCKEDANEVYADGLRSSLARDETRGLDSEETNSHVSNMVRNRVPTSESGCSKEVR